MVIPRRRALIHTPSCLQSCRCSCGNRMANAEGLPEGAVPPRQEQARDSRHRVVGAAVAWREAGSGGPRRTLVLCPLWSASLPCGSRPKDPLRWENDSQGLRCGCVSY